MTNKEITKTFVKTTKNLMSSGFSETEAKKIAKQIMNKAATIITSQTMNKVYEQLKTFTITEIKKMKDLANTKFNVNSKAYFIFRNQCNFAISKKLTGKW